MPFSIKEHQLYSELFTSRIGVNTAGSIYANAGFIGTPKEIILALKTLLPGKHSTDKVPDSLQESVERLREIIENPNEYIFPYHHNAIKGSNGQEELVKGCDKTQEEREADYTEFRDIAYECISNAIKELQKIPGKEQKSYKQNKIQLAKEAKISQEKLQNTPPPRPECRCLTEEEQRQKLWQLREMKRLGIELSPETFIESEKPYSIEKTLNTPPAVPSDMEISSSTAQKCYHLNHVLNALKLTTQHKRHPFIPCLHSASLYKEVRNTALSQLPEAMPKSLWKAHITKDVIETVMSNLGHSDKLESTMKQLSLNTAHAVH